MLMIDGHNLIGKMPGMRLSDADDETRLVEFLQIYCRVKQRDVTVYFDGAAPGYARKQKHGRVTAIFVVRSSQADDAMIQHLLKLGRKARNQTVVTSDRKIQTQARSVGAQVISSEVFVDALLEAGRLALDQPSPGQPVMSSVELDEWLCLFQTPQKDKQKGK